MSQAPVVSRVVDSTGNRLMNVHVRWFSSTRLGGVSPVSSRGIWPSNSNATILATLPRGPAQGRLAGPRLSLVSVYSAISCGFGFNSESVAMGHIGGVRFASKKAKGSTKNNRGSPGKRLGKKVADGELVRPGMILIKQRGTKYRPSVGVARARDSSLYSLEHGRARFVRESNPHGRLHKRVYLTIEPLKDPQAEDKDSRPQLYTNRFKKKMAVKHQVAVPVYKEKQIQDKWSRIAAASSLEEALTLF